MRLVLAALVALFLLMLPEAASAQGCGPTNPNCIVPTAPPGTSDNRAASTAFVANSQTVISIFSFGAQCNGNTSHDDAPAVNAAINFIRNPPFGPFGQLWSAKLVGSLNRQCIFLTPINITGFNGPVVTSPIIQDLYFWCLAANQPCLDGLGSRGITLKDVYGVIGSATVIPSYGLQIGRIDNNNYDLWNIDNVSLTGFATKCIYYNYGSETSTHTHVFFFNRNGAFATCLDGYNRFNITSTFITQTNAQGTAQSFLNNVFHASSFGSRCDLTPIANCVASGTNAAPIFLANTGQLRFVDSYVCSACGALGTSNFAIIIDQEQTTGYGGAGIRDINFDLNVEQNGQSGATSSIFFTSCKGQSGSFSAATSCSALHGGVTDLATRNLHLEGSVFGEILTSGFQLDSGITSMTMDDLHIQNSAGLTNSAVIFDQPALYTIRSGDVRVGLATLWNEPNFFTGTVCAIQCVHYDPIRPLNRNPDFVLDQPNEGNAVTPAGTATVVDGWVTNLAGAGAGSSLTFQRVVDAPAGFVNSEKATVAVPFSPAAATHYSLLSLIEGPDASQLQWGTASAHTIGFDFCAKANNTGTYAISLQNNNVDRSYVVTYTIAQANVWQCFHNVVPGPTTGNWSNLKNVAGIFIFWTFAAGSNFNTTAGSWQNGLFLNTAGTFNFTNTGAATLQITAVHIYDSPYKLPYMARPFETEIKLANRFYQKSFPMGVKPVTNGGTAGAVTMLAPYANATFGTLGIGVKFDPPMFRSGGTVNPILTFFSTNVASANCYNSTAPRAGDLGAVTEVSASTGDSGFFITCASAGLGYAIGDQVQFNWTADTRN